MASTAAVDEKRNTWRNGGNDENGGMLTIAPLPLGLQLQKVPSNFLALPSRAHFLPTARESHDSAALLLPFVAASAGSAAGPTILAAASDMKALLRMPLVAEEASVVIHRVAGTLVVDNGGLPASNAGRARDVLSLNKFVNEQEIYSKTVHWAHLLTKDRAGVPAAPPTTAPPAPPAPAPAATRRLVPDHLLRPVRAAVLDPAVPPLPAALSPLEAEAASRSKRLTARSGPTMGGSPFRHLTLWQLQDVSMVLGSDLLSFALVSSGSSRDGGADLVSLHLQDASTPVTQTDALDLWLSNKLAGIPRVAVCRHDDHVVAGWDVLNVDEVLQLSQPPLNVADVELETVSLLRFLQAACTRDGSYCLTRSGDDIMRLTELTHTTDARYESHSQSWQRHMAMLCLRYAKSLEGQERCLPGPGADVSVGRKHLHLLGLRRRLLLQAAQSLAPASSERGHDAHAQLLDAHTTASDPEVTGLCVEIGRSLASTYLRMGSLLEDPVIGGAATAAAAAIDGGSASSGSGRPGAPSSFPPSLMVTEREPTDVAVSEDIDARTAAVAALNEGARQLLYLLRLLPHRSDESTRVIDQLFITAARISQLLLQHPDNKHLAMRVLSDALSVVASVRSGAEGVVMVPQRSLDVAALLSEMAAPAKVALYAALGKVFHDMSERDDDDVIVPVSLQRAVSLWQPSSTVPPTTHGWKPLDPDHLSAKAFADAAALCHEAVVQYSSGVDVAALGQDGEWLQQGITQAWRGYGAALVEQGKRKMGGTGTSGGELDPAVAIQLFSRAADCFDHVEDKPNAVVARLNVSAVLRLTASAAAAAAANSAGASIPLVCSDSQLCPLVDAATRLCSSAAVRAQAASTASAAHVVVAVSPDAVTLLEKVVAVSAAAVELAAGQEAPLRLRALESLRQSAMLYASLLSQHITRREEAQAATATAAATAPSAAPAPDPASGIDRVRYALGVAQAAIDAAATLGPDAEASRHAAACAYQLGQHVYRLHGQGAASTEEADAALSRASDCFHSLAAPYVRVLQLHPRIDRARLWWTTATDAVEAERERLLERCMAATFECRSSLADVHKACAAEAKATPGGGVAVPPDALVLMRSAPTDIVNILSGALKDLVHLRRGQQRSGSNEKKLKRTQDAYQLCLRHLRDADSSGASVFNNLLAVERLLHAVEDVLP